MGSLIFRIMACGLAVSGVVGADDYYQQNAGPGSINWPPPGGVAAAPQRAPGYGYASPLNSGLNQGFRPYPEYQQNQQYLYQRQNRQPPELITPPGEDWPNAAYHRQFDSSVMPEYRGELRPEPVQKGVPVEVVPPPSIPIDEVKVPVSETPKRDWRPMKEKEKLEAMEETAVPPETVVDRSEPRMRAIELPMLPPQADDGTATTTQSKGEVAASKSQ